MKGSITEQEMDKTDGYGSDFKRNTDPASGSRYRSDPADPTAVQRELGRVGTVGPARLLRRLVPAPAKPPICVGSGFVIVLHRSEEGLVHSDVVDGACSRLHTEFVLPK